MVIKQDLIELASTKEKEEFVIQEFKANRDSIQNCSMDGVATYFSHMHNIRFSKEYWVNVLWTKLKDSL